MNAFIHSFIAVVGGMLCKSDKPSIIIIIIIHSFKPILDVLSAPHTHTCLGVLTTGGRVMLVENSIINFLPSHFATPHV